MKKEKILDDTEILQYLYKQELIKIAENFFEIWKERFRENVEEGIDKIDEIIPDKNELKSIVEETINKIEFENKTRDFYEEDEETKGFFRRLIKK